MAGQRFLVPSVKVRVLVRQPCLAVDIDLTNEYWRWSIWVNLHEAERVNVDQHLNSLTLPDS